MVLIKTALISLSNMCGGDESGGGGAKAESAAPSSGCSTNANASCSDERSFPSGRGMFTPAGIWREPTSKSATITSSWKHCNSS